MPLPLTTSRIAIETFSQKHLNDSRYLAWLSDRETLISLNLTSYILRPVTKAQLAQYVEGFERCPADRLFAVTLVEGDLFVGTATLREIGYRGLYDLGILIGDKSVRGRGLASEVIATLAPYAFGELGARKITSSFTDDNFAVMRAFLKSGFKIEGFQRAQQMSIDGRISNRYIVGLLPSDLNGAKG